MFRILVVDDDDSTLMFYANELSEEGYEVATCADGGILMDLIKQTDPDLVVMDVRLGQYNGLDLLKKIRHITYSLPVILCSAYRVYRYDAVSISADDYVVKSVDLGELKFKIKRALEEESQVYKGLLHHASYAPMPANCLFTKG